MVVVASASNRTLRVDAADDDDDKDDALLLSLFLLSMVGLVGVIPSLER